MTNRAHHLVVPRRHRVLHRLLIALAALSVMTPSTVLSGAIAAAKEPNTPIVEDVDVTFPAPNLTRICGVDVTAHVYGTFTFMVLPNGVELDRIRYQHVFSGPGGSVSFNHVENVQFTTTTSPDGPYVDTLTVTGTLLYHAVVPGEGSLVNNSGREILQFTWQWDDELGDYVLVDEQVVSDVGPNDDFSDADYAVICDQLT